MIINRYEFTKISNQNLPLSWQSQSALDDLQAFLQQNWEQRSVFYNDQEINSRQQFLDFQGQRSIKTKKYIGTIVFKGEQLNIYPRVFKTEKDDLETDNLSQKHLMTNLVKWIEYCNKMSYPFLNVSSELSDAEDLKELFITLYINYTRSAIERGIYYCYVDETDDLNNLKGKFDALDYITKKIPSGESNKFKCTYSKFEFDNEVNRIIKYTCKMLYGITSKKNQRILRTILTRLEDVADVKCSPVDCDGIRLSRLNKNYGIIISMSKMFLLNKTANYSLDTNDSFCFLFPTDMLFEGFVGGYIRETLKEYGGTVKLQESKMSLVNKIIFNDIVTGAAFTMRHDILAEYDKKVFILDTKYKEISRFTDNPNYLTDVNNEVLSTDLYQVFEYARKRDVDDVYLLYPMFRFEEKESSFPIGISESPSKDINVHLIRIPFVFEDDIEHTKEMITSVISDIFGLKQHV